MAYTPLTFLPTRTRRELEEVRAELGLRDTIPFVRRAVEEKLLSFKRGTFFAITDRVARGLRRKKISPEALVRDLHR